MIWYCSAFRSNELFCRKSKKWSNSIIVDLNNQKSQIRNRISNPLLLHDPNSIDHGFITASLNAFQQVSQCQSIHTIFSAYSISLKMQNSIQDVFAQLPKQIPQSAPVTPLLDNPIEKGDGEGSLNPLGNDLLIFLCSTIGIVPLFKWLKASPVIGFLSAGELALLIAY
jgi:hypothetical protein